MIKFKKKEAWPRFLAKVLILVSAILLLFSWVEGRFRVGIDSQVIRCFPDHKFFLVDMKDLRPVRDRIIAYRAKGLQPYFVDGTMMGKTIKGLPGDHLVINEAGVFINEVQVAEGFPLAERLSRPISEFFKDEVIPEGKYFLMAPAPESYDGRYWGYISQSQIVGKATPFL